LVTVVMLLELERNSAKARAGVEAARHRLGIIATIWDIAVVESAAESGFHQGGLLEFGQNSIIHVAMLHAILYNRPHSKVACSQ
jgi:hypothetical protein